MITRVSIEVTEEDIRQGERKKCQDCALARAFSRAFNKPILINGSGRVWIVGLVFAREGLVGDLSLEARNFMKAFDSGEIVHPQTFDFLMEVLE